MSGFPNSPTFVLSGYSTEEIPTLQDVTSLRYPDGYPLQFAYGYRVNSTEVDPTGRSYFSNAYQIEYGSSGRPDNGSSGSGIFDSSGHLLGSLSTGLVDCKNRDANGNCPAGSNPCDVNVNTWYQKFGPVYAIVKDYLEEEIPSPPATNPSVFSASPKPAVSPTGVTSVTLTYNAPGDASLVEIHVGSPGGTLLARGGPSGTAVASGWVSNGMQFYLQDVTNGKPLTSANTLGEVTVSVLVGESSGPGSTNPNVFSATPNPIYSASGVGSTTLSYNAPSGVGTVEIRVGSPTGSSLARNGPSGSAQASGWVTNGMQFYLQDVTSGEPGSTLAVVTATVTASSVGEITANPATIANPNGSPLGATTLSWFAPYATSTEVHVGSPTGTLFVGGGSSGSATTGNWVTDGMTFYLMDTSNGPASAQSVISTVTVHVGQTGGSTIPAGTISLYLDPNPIIAMPGQLASTTVHWNSGGISTVEIHIGSVTGPLLAEGGATGSASAGGWVTDGMQFFMVNGLTHQQIGQPATAQFTSNPIGVGGTWFTMGNVSQNPDGTIDATLTWATDSTYFTAVCSNAPGGQMLGSGGRGGAIYVHEQPANTVFYLQDMSASFTLRAEQGGTFFAYPNPIVASGNGTGADEEETRYGTTTFVYNTGSNIGCVEIHSESPDGPLIDFGCASSGGVSGNSVLVAPPPSVFDGTTFYLQDTTNGKPLTAANTISTVTVTVTPPSNPPGPTGWCSNNGPFDHVSGTYQYTLATTKLQ